MFTKTPYVEPEVVDTNTTAPRDAMEVEDTTPMTPAERAAVMPIPAPEKEQRVSTPPSSPYSDGAGSELIEPPPVAITHLRLRSGIAYQLPKLTKPPLLKKGRGGRKGKGLDGPAGLGPTPCEPITGLHRGPGAQQGHPDPRAGTAQDQPGFQASNPPDQGGVEAEVGGGTTNGGNLQRGRACEKLTGEPQLSPQKGKEPSNRRTFHGSDHGTSKAAFGYSKGKGKQDGYQPRIDHFVPPKNFVAGNYGLKKNILPGSYTMTSTPMLHNSTRAFVLPQFNKTNRLREASDSNSSMDEWMKNVNDLHSILMNKNELLQQEVNRLSSQQQEDKLKIEKTAAIVGRSNSHIMDIKNITQSLETRAVNTGEDVEKLHSSIHACRKVMDTCIKVNHEGARDIGNIMEAVNTMNSQPTKDWDVVTALFGDIQQQMNTITTSLNDLKIGKGPARAPTPGTSEEIVKTDTSDMRELPPHMLKQEEVEAPVRSEKKFKEESEHTPSILEMPVSNTNFKNFPKTSAYPTYSGKPEEDWVRFIEDIDILKNAYALPDSEIVSKLPSLLIGIAYTWYRIAGRENTAVCWQTWKQLIKNRFGNAEWRQKQLQLLDGDKFTFEISDVSEYLMNMHRRIESIYPGMGNEDIRMHILMRLPGEIRNLIMPHPASNMEISSFLALCAQVITGTKEYQQGQTREKTGNNARRR